MGGSGQATGSAPRAATPAVASPAPVAEEDDAPFNSAESAPAVKVAEQAQVAKEDAPASSGSEASARAQDILAMIRNRQKAE